MCKNGQFVPPEPDRRPGTDGPAGIGRIAASLEALADAGALDFPILAPALAYLPAAAMPAGALLAIHDLNGLLFAALSGPGGGRERLVAGIFCCDPLRGPDRLAQRLGACGVGRVVNFPSVGLFDGEVRRDLAEFGFHYEAELDVLVRLRELGFEVIASVAEEAQLAAARRRAIATVLFDAARADQLAPGRAAGERVLLYRPDGAGPHGSGVLAVRAFSGKVDTTFPVRKRDNSRA